MEEAQKEKLEILRQRIPIGIRHGLLLLEKNSGDIEKAEKQFVEEMVSVITDKTNVTPDIALTKLWKYKFDIGQTIKTIEDDQYTFSELILRKFKDKKEDALNKIMSAVEDKNNLERESWLDFDPLKVLPTDQYCFLIIMEWLAYESWEGYETALTFNIEIVVEQFTQLGFTDLSDSLLQASKVQAALYTEYKTGKNIQNYIDAVNELRHNVSYKKCVEIYNAQRPSVINKLFELVENNIDKYP